MQDEDDEKRELGDGDTDDPEQVEVGKPVDVKTVTVSVRESADRGEIIEAIDKYLETEDVEMLLQTGTALSIYITKVVGPRKAT